MRSVEQGLHQLEGTLLRDAGRGLAQQELQQALADVILPVERALQVQVLERGRERGKRRSATLPDGSFRFTVDHRLETRNETDKRVRAVCLSTAVS